MIKTPLSTVIGGAFWTPEATVINGAKLSFEIVMKKLFANGEQGFWYDPNDLSTMYQDATGTVPVTSVGQPVGLVLDKSKGLVSGTNTVLNGDFSQGGTSWGFTGGVTFSGGKAVYDGLNNPSIYQNVPNIELGAFYKVRFTISNLVTDALAVRIGGGAFNFGFNQNKTYEVILPAVGTGLLQFAAAGSGAVLELSDISVKKLSGNHAYQATSASRPVLRKNAVTGANYLEFDGTDDFLQTSNIDFTGTDKVSLFAGVRKLSDAAIGMLCELSPILNNNNGTFYLATPGNATGRIDFVSKGTKPSSATYLDSLVSAPSSFVVSTNASISEDIVNLRLNSSLVAPPNIADQGTGNFGNHPLFIGRRGGTALPFNGHIYGLIGIGKLTSDNETVAIEKELAKRTGVTLNV